MDINKFTQKSREAVQDAQALTIEYGNMQIEQAHLLYALQQLSEQFHVERRRQRVEKLHRLIQQHA